MDSSPRDSTVGHSLAPIHFQVNAMFLLLFFLSVYTDCSCNAQFAYSGLLPYDPPAYALRRPPPVRRSAIEALERLRLPVARYFPQVDTQAAPYPVGPAGYPGGDLYALPPQWAEEFAPQPVEEEQPEYGDYEYETYNPAIYRPQQQAPVYAEEIYPQDPESSEYNDLMESYLMGIPKRPPPPQAFENIQRRSEEPIVSSTPSPTVLPPTPQVQMTAVPASPEKKNVKSLVVPDPAPEPEVIAPTSGQKEEPLFRPLHSSQRTTWSEGSPLSRAKNTMHKTPIPLLKQIIQSGREVKSEEDPLMQELSSLKKSL